MQNRLPVLVFSAGVRGQDMGVIRAWCMPCMGHPSADGPKSSFWPPRLELRQLFTSRAVQMQGVRRAGQPSFSCSWEALIEAVRFTSTHRHKDPDETDSQIKPGGKN